MNRSRLTIAASIVCDVTDQQRHVVRSPVVTELGANPVISLWMKPALICSNRCVARLRISRPGCFPVQSKFPWLNDLEQTNQAEKSSLLNGSVLPANTPGYNLSFTAASLRPELSRVVAETFIELRDWALVKDRILTSNSLQCRTLAGAERQERELRRRLMGLTKPQIGLLASATADDRAAIAWLAALKHIRFAFEIVMGALGVLRQLPTLVDVDIPAGVDAVVDL